MAWTTPKTWVTGDPVNESNMNTYIRDNQVALKAQVDAADASRALLAANFASRTKTVSGSPSALAANADVFGAPILELTIQKANAHVLAGCQVTFVIGSSGPHRVELRLRCYQAGSPAKTVDAYLDFEGRTNEVISQLPTTPFLGFAQGTVSFTVTLTDGGGDVSLNTGDHLIWAMEL